MQEIDALLKIKQLVEDAQNVARDIQTESEQDWGKENRTVVKFLLCSLEQVLKDRIAFIKNN